MSVAHPQYVEALAEQLAGQLEEEAQVLRQGRLRLAALSEALAGNDQGRMEHLLEEADRQAASAQGAEQPPARTIRQLAEALDCLEDPPALSRLIDRLGPSHRPAVAMARAKVLEEARQVRLQYRQTASLLWECMKVNRALLEGLFPTAGAVNTYDVEGPRQWRAGGGLVDAER